MELVDARNWQGAQVLGSAKNGALLSLRELMAVGILLPGMH